MSDQEAGAFEGETPVNPYSLMGAVNQTSQETRRGWFVFLALMTYLMISVAGIGHKDLLLSKDVPLPLVQISVDLQRFFLFAPIVLCFLHFGLLMQHALLARKVLEFHRALRSLEATDAPRHPLRLELHAYFFTQSLAGPQRAPLMSFFLHLQGWLTLIALPVLLLLYMQVSFLPYHDIEITWAQRIVLLFDVLLVCGIGFFLMRTDLSLRGAVGRTLAQRPVFISLTGLLLIGTMLFSLMAATVPGEAFDRIAPRAPASVRWAMAQAFPLLRDPHADTAFGFRRNLVVMDVDLVDDKNVTAGQTSLNLRGRDLRGARLDRSDLHLADFTGALLDDANLTAANLKGAALGCQELSELRSGNRRAANCTSLRGAILTRAKAAGTQFNGADLTGAVLIETQLEGAELNEALLTGANLWQAQLERAEFTAAVLPGANLLQAKAQGANFFGANLQGVDLTSAGLQGAVLRNALLQGAILEEADLDGAELAGARLTGARLAGARLTGADLQGARIWQTSAPSRDMMDLADLQDLRVRPPEDNERVAAKAMIAGLVDGRLKARLTEVLGPLLDAGGGERWRSSLDASAWQALASSASRTDGESFRSQVTSYLAALGCRPRWGGTGAVAAGIALRSSGPRFKGNAETLYARFTAPDCAAAKSVPAKLLRDMSAAFDDQRGVQGTVNTLSSRGASEAGGGSLSGPFPVPGGGTRQ